MCLGSDMKAWSRSGRSDRRTPYEHDVVIDRGDVRKRIKKPSKPHRAIYGHTPLSADEDIPWSGSQLIIGTGAYGCFRSCLTTRIAGCRTPTGSELDESTFDHCDGVGAVRSGAAATGAVVRSGDQGDRLHVSGRGEPEDLAVEGQLGRQAAQLVLRPAEAVTLALEAEVCVRYSPFGERVDDRLRLRRRYDLIVQALQEEQRAGETLQMGQR